MAASVRAPVTAIFEYRSLSMRALRFSAGNERNSRRDLSDDDDCANEQEGSEHRAAPRNRWSIA